MSIENRSFLVCALPIPYVWVGAHSRRRWAEDAPGNPFAEEEPIDLWNSRTKVAAYRGWQDMVRWAYSKEWSHRDPFQGQVTVAAQFFMPIPKKWNKQQVRMALDGELSPQGVELADLLKGVLKSLTVVAYQDDRSVTDFHAQKLFAPDPGAKITITGELKQ